MLLKTSQITKTAAAIFSGMGSVLTDSTIALDRSI